MSREKQIEEMAKVIEQARIKATDTTNSMNYGFGGWYAKELYAKGYRKASDVASEIFEEIEHTARAAIILLKFDKDEKIRNTKTECYTDLIGYLAELKKKYTEEKRNA